MTRELNASSYVAIDTVKNQASARFALVKVQGPVVQLEDSLGIIENVYPLIWLSMVQ